MKNIVSISFTLVILGLILSCKTNKSNKANNQNSDQPNINEINTESEHLLIYLKRGACFGKCPEDEMAIYDDGTYIYKGERNTDYIGLHKGQLDKSVIKDIKTRMESINFKEIPSEFGMHVTDLPQKNVVVRYEKERSEFQYIQSKYDDLNDLVRMAGDLHKNTKLSPVRAQE